MIVKCFTVSSLPSSLLKIAVITTHGRDLLAAPAHLRSVFYIIYLQTTFENLGNLLDWSNHPRFVSVRQQQMVRGVRSVMRNASLRSSVKPQTNKQTWRDAREKNQLFERGVTETYFVA